MIKTIPYRVFRIELLSSGLVREKVVYNEKDFHALTKKLRAWSKSKNELMTIHINDPSNEVSSHSCQIYKDKTWMMSH